MCDLKGGWPGLNSRAPGRIQSKISVGILVLPEGYWFSGVVRPASPKSAIFPALFMT